MYTITLSDGSKLENLRLNGNNFIANYQLSEADFKYKLSSIDIESDSPVTEPMFGIELGHHENMQLLALQHGESYMKPGEYWFALGPIPEEEMRYAETNAKIAYLAMMTDVDFE